MSSNRHHENGEQRRYSFRNKSRNLNYNESVMSASAAFGVDLNGTNFPRNMSQHARTYSGVSSSVRSNGPCNSNGYPSHQQATKTSNSNHNRTASNHNYKQTTPSIIYPSVGPSLQAPNSFYPSRAHSISQQSTVNIDLRKNISNYPNIQESIVQYPSLNAHRFNNVAAVATTARSVNPPNPNYCSMPQINPTSYHAFAKYNNKVELVKLNSFDLVTVLMKPRNIEDTLAPTGFSTLEIAQALHNDQFRVFLRFCKFAHGQTEQLDSLPKAFTLAINNQHFSVKNKYTFAPYDITPRVIYEKTPEITIRCTIDQTEYSSEYCYGVYLVRKTDHKKMLTNFKLKGLHAIEDTYSMVKKILSADADDDDGISIVNEDITLSLLCPITSVRIKTPARSIKCHHVQCFDAESFISINEVTPRWKCPICKIYIKFDDLITDGLFSLILKEAPLKCTDVHVFVDGSYKFLGISKDSSSESVAEKSKFVQIKSEGSDDSQQMNENGKLMCSDLCPNENIKETESAHSSSVVVDSVKSKTVEIECITIDSDDDEEQVSKDQSSDTSTDSSSSSDNTVIVSPSHTNGQSKSLIEPTSQEPTNCDNGNIVVDFSLNFSDNPKEIAKRVKSKQRYQEESWRKNKIPKSSKSSHPSAKFIDSSSSSETEDSEDEIECIYEGPKVTSQSSSTKTYSKSTNKTSNMAQYPSSIPLASATTVPSVSGLATNVSIPSSPESIDSILAIAMAKASRDNRGTSNFDQHSPKQPQVFTKKSVSTSKSSSTKSTGSGQNSASGSKVGTQQQSYRGNISGNRSSSLLYDQQSAVPLPPNHHYNHLLNNGGNSLLIQAKVQQSNLNSQNRPMAISNEGIKGNLLDAVPAPSINDTVNFNHLFSIRPSAAARKTNSTSVVIPPSLHSSSTPDRSQSTPLVSNSVESYSCQNVSSPALSADSDVIGNAVASETSGQGPGSGSSLNRFDTVQSSGFAYSQQQPSLNFWDGVEQYDSSANGNEFNFYSGTNNKNKPLPLLPQFNSNITSSGVGNAYTNSYHQTIANQNDPTNIYADFYRQQLSGNGSSGNQSQFQHNQNHY